MTLRFNRRLPTYPFCFLLSRVLIYSRELPDTAVRPLRPTVRHAVLTRPIHPHSLLSCTYYKQLRLIMNIVVILTHTLAQYTMYLTDRTNNLITNIKSRKSYRTGAQGIRQLGSKGHVESQAQAVIDRTLKRSRTTQCQLPHITIHTLRHTLLPVNYNQSQTHQIPYTRLLGYQPLFLFYSESFLDFKICDKLGGNMSQYVGGHSEIAAIL